MKMTKETKNIWAILAITGLVFVSCEKTVEPSLPGDTESAGLNFHVASEAMHTAYGSGQNVTAAYVDTVADDRDLFTYSTTDSKYPLFVFGFLDAHQYPRPVEQSSISLMSYVRYNAGDHHILFTDVTNTIVKDTTLSLQGSSWNTLYLADLPTTNGPDAVYTILHVEEPRESREGLTGIRFINLSPDAGRLQCRALLTDGTPDANALAEVGFREVSEYTYLTHDQVSNGLLRFQIGNTDANLTTGVRALAGRSFVVVIRGFLNGATRQIATGRDTNGSIVKQTVAIEPGISAEVRASY